MYGVPGFWDYYLGMRFQQHRPCNQSKYRCHCTVHGHEAFRPSQCLLSSTLIRWLPIFVAWKPQLYFLRIRLVKHSSALAPDAGRGQPRRLLWRGWTPSWERWSRPEGLHPGSLLRSAMLWVDGSNPVFLGQTYRNARCQGKPWGEPSKMVVYWDVLGRKVPSLQWGMIIEDPSSIICYYLVTIINH